MKILLVSVFFYCSYANQMKIYDFFTFQTLACGYAHRLADAEEEYQIKSMCMLALLELLISCRMFPKVGDRLNGRFHHVPRLERLKSESIR